MKQQVNKQTGEIIEPEKKLGQMITIRTIRPNGKLRIQTSYEFCPSLTEPIGALDTDINYLVKKYKPDELALYLAARTAHKEEIAKGHGHDYSQEPDRQEALNQMYASKKAYEKLPKSLRDEFPTYLEFLKFIDNPQNEKILLETGILTVQQLENVKVPETPSNTTTPTTTSKEEKKDK